MVLQVVPEELGRVRGFLEKCEASLGRVYVNTGGEGAFGVPVLVCAAARFAYHFEDRATQGASRAVELADGLVVAQRNFTNTDDEAADGARALGESSHRFGHARSNGIVIDRGTGRVVSYHGLTH
ncbi:MULTISPECIES: hypothetical protein [unclassified Actinomyces]|uniref:hypothetical protein n=1 Tax=unclassified Actinomyces TaxID=2609248 RepID=UPI000D58FDC1|nr:MULTISPECIES: hypothetical protein [unclassified Actinomyces]RAX24551.1 hypothetical protein DRB07_00645 [Actinomyces sp. Z3]